jgi:hypothetical protein
MMDRIGQSNTPPPKVNLAGIEMIERATVPFSIKKMLRGKSTSYRENMTNRSTEYVFERGRIVYELISPDHTYIMQSYAMIVDTSLNMAGLDSFEKKLKLPKGWKFRVRTLDEDLVLKTIEGGEAFVIRDELQNFNQRVK